MVIAIFRSRVADKHMEEFEKRYDEMSKLIAEIPGYGRHDRFTTDDGEGVVVVEFTTKEGFEAWDTHPEHKKAKMLGKEYIFESYDVMVGDVFERHQKP